MTCLIVLLPQVPELLWPACYHAQLVVVLSLILCSDGDLLWQALLYHARCSTPLFCSAVNQPQLLMKRKKEKLRRQ